MFIIGTSEIHSYNKENAGQTLQMLSHLSASYHAITHVRICSPYVTGFAKRGLMHAIINI